MKSEKLKKKKKKKKEKWKSDYSITEPNAI